MTLFRGLSEQQASPGTSGAGPYQIKRGEAEEEALVKAVRPLVDGLK